jgi:hypothetical protein
MTLRICRDNPRYFCDAAGRPVYLTGSHTWNNLHDLGEPLDYARYLDRLVELGHNFVRLWVFEQACGLQWAQRQRDAPWAAASSGSGRRSVAAITRSSWTPGTINSTSLPTHGAGRSNPSRSGARWGRRCAWRKTSIYARRCRGPSSLRADIASPTRATLTSSSTPAPRTSKLRARPGTYRLRWLDPCTGEVLGRAVLPAEACSKLEPPAPGPIVLVAMAQDELPDQGDPG